MKHATLNLYKVAFFNGENTCIYHVNIWSDTKYHAIKKAKLCFTMDTTKLYNGDNIKAQNITNY